MDAVAGGFDGGEGEIDFGEDAGYVVPFDIALAAVVGGFEVSANCCEASTG